MRNVGPTADQPEGRICLCPRGEQNRWHNPLSFHPALFRQFAELEETPEAAADFASKFGGLFGPKYRPLAAVTPEAGADFASRLGGLFGPRHLGTVTLESAVGQCWFEDDTENFADWLTQIQRMRRLVSSLDEAISKGEYCRPFFKDMRSPRLILELVERGRRPGLSLQPDTLISALDLQFFRVVAGLSEILACEHCGTWFERGPGKGRRGKARFCSDKCRFDYHNFRKGTSR